MRSSLYQHLGRGVSWRLTSQVIDIYADWPYHCFRMACEKVISVCSFDGQTIWGEKNTPFFEVGNFLGGGAAGNICDLYLARSAV